MKTKALLLTLMVLTMWSCSNDDNGTTEEQEEITELIIEKATFNYLNSNETIVIYFDSVGRITHFEQLSDSGLLTYEYVYNPDNSIMEKTLFYNGALQQQLIFLYDDAGRLIQVSREDQTGTNFIIEFNYSGNTVELTYPLNPYLNPSYYTFDSNNRLINSEVKDWETNIHIATDYIYAGNNLTQIKTTYLNCSDCEDEIIVLTYDNHPNPLLNDFGNKFFYYSDADPYSFLGRFHFSVNNYLTYTPDNGAYYMESIIEYNQYGYPVSINEYDNENPYCTITFEYYE